MACPRFAVIGQRRFFMCLTAAGPYRIFTCFPEMTERLYHPLVFFATEKCFKSGSYNKRDGAPTVPITNYQLQFIAFK